MPLWIISNDLLLSSLILLFVQVCCWTPLVNFSVQLLQSSTPQFLFDSFKIFFLCWNYHFVYSSFSWAHWASLWLLFWIPCPVIHISYFFCRISFYRFILFLCLGHFPLLLYILCHFVLVSAHLKKQPFLFLYVLAFYRRRPSPISLPRDSESFSSLLCGYIFPGFVREDS